MTRKEEASLDRNRAGWKGIFRTKQKRASITLTQPPAQRKPHDHANRHKQEIPTTQRILYQINEAEISVYKPIKPAHAYDSEDMISSLKYHSSSLITQGKFKIYKMNHSETTYFQCGDVIHPILPNLKVIKINDNTYILPMSNPKRYWKLSLNVLKNDDFDQVIDNICQFKLNPIDFDLVSPFNSFLVDDDEDTQEEAAQRAQGDDNDNLSYTYTPIIHHPVPIASSINSMKSSLLLNDTMSLSINSIGKELEMDLDEDIDESFNLNEKHIGKAVDNYRNDDSDDNDSMNDLNDTLISLKPKKSINQIQNVSKRFSLTFKSIPIISDESEDVPNYIDNSKIVALTNNDIKKIIESDNEKSTQWWIF